MTVPYDPEHITYFAETDYRNQRARFGIKSRDRTRHMYVIGKSGVGKSTLLENMAIQDINRGEGLAVLDPHGSFAEKMLEYIPQERIKDVIYFAPFDTEFPISFNVLEDVGADKRHFVASGLMSTFKKIWVDAWSARMEYILNNILLALLEYPDATLLGVNRMLSDKDFRNKVVANTTDPGVKAFWVEEFAKYGDRYMQEAGAAIQNKVGQLTANPLIRNIIGQPKSSFDIREAMDNQKILIVNLSKGRIGEQNTALLGSMIITKIYLAAMSRADATASRLAELPNFYFYVDEFQSFANESFANILSEARKYKLALVIAHQYVAQMEESVRDAVFGNVGTSISFRVGPLDGELLEKVFAPQFTANDLINLGMAQIYLSLLINDMGSAPFSARTLPPAPRPAISYKDDVIESSREIFSQPRGEVEKNILDWYGSGQPAAPASAPYQPRTEAPAQRPQAPRSPRPDQPSTPIAPKFQKPQPSPTHNPFKKAFSSNLPEVQAPELNPGTSKLSRPTPETSISPALNSLLSSLDSSTSASPIPAVPATRAPFTGEKPLREAIPPVKMAERGPTEKNRDLLKAALQNVMATNPTPAKSVPPPASAAVGLPKADSDISTKSATPVITAQEHPPETPPLAPTEVPYQTLRKVLE